MPAEATQCQPSPRHAFFESQAALLARAGEYARAAQWLDALHQEADPRPETLCLLGKIHVQRGDFAEGRQSFVAALGLDPGMTEAAAALARLDRLRQPVPAVQVRAWRLGVAGLTVALLALLGAYSLAGTRTPPSSDLSLAQASGHHVQPSASHFQLSASHAQSSASQAEDCRLYAHSVEQLRPWCLRWNLQTEPDFTSGRLAIKIAGAVPSEHLHNVIASVPLALPLDTSALRVHPHYVVGPDETLGQIAQEICGAAWRWRSLWHANRSVLSDPHLIQPATPLVIPGS